MSRSQVTLQENDAYILATLGQDALSGFDHKMRKALNEVVETSSKHLVVDMGAINYIYSSSISLLVGTMTVMDKQGRRMALINISDEVSELLDSLHLADVMLIYDSVEEFLTSQGI